ncbi:unnamed protein product [Amoebophrya sp. A120]|nr:unnamed protein product [Amoebophrya sp. A120]|eukprot:GSA120T00000139001.1
MTSQGAVAELSGAPPMDVDARSSTEEIRIRNFAGLEHTVRVDPSEVSTVGDLYNTNVLSLFLDLETELVPPFSLVRWIQIRDEVDGDKADGANSCCDDGADLDYTGGDCSNEAGDDTTRRETTARGKQGETAGDKHSDATPSAFLDAGSEIEFGREVAYQFVIAHSGHDLRRGEEESLEEWETRVRGAVNGLKTVDDAQAFIYDRVYACVPVEKYEEVLRGCIPVGDEQDVLQPDMSTLGRCNLVRAAVALSSEEWRKHGKLSDGLYFSFEFRQDFCVGVALELTRPGEYFINNDRGHLSADYLELLEQTLELGQPADENYTLLAEAIHEHLCREDHDYNRIRLLVKCLARTDEMGELLDYFKLRYSVRGSRHRDIVFFSARDFVNTVMTGVQSQQAPEQIVASARRLLGDEILPRILNFCDQGLMVFQRFAAMLDELDIDCDLEPIMEEYKNKFFETNGEKLERAGVTACFREIMERQLKTHNIDWLKWSDVEDLWRNS